MANADPWRFGASRIRARRCGACFALRFAFFEITNDQLELIDLTVELFAMTGQSAPGEARPAGP